MMKPSPSVIEILESRIAPATFTVVNGNDSGVGSLRDAIVGANTAAGEDTISITNLFVALTSPLPAITDKVQILAPDSTIDGLNAGAGAQGLVFTGASAGSTVDALTFTRFKGDSLVLSNGGSNHILEIKIDGMTQKSTGHGILITSPNNLIEASNINNNGIDGIHIEGANASGNTIRESGIISGFDDGVVGRVGGDGIAIVNASNTIIDSNLIGETAQNGMHVSGVAATGNQLRSNKLGGHGASGVLIENSSGNTIGGVDPGFGNQFFTYALNAVRVTGGNAVTNAIVGNVYFESDKVLIDLGGDGLTPNDPSPDA